MTEQQELKMQLLKEFANVNEPKTIDTCKRMYEFLAGTNEQKPLPAKQQLADGVYFIVGKSNYTVDSEIVSAEYDAPDNTGGILLVQGRKSIVIALQDCNDGKDLTLTHQRDPESCKGNYITSYEDAVADWDGEKNTEHLKKVGLNLNLNLEAGLYIPSMAEMLFIFTHKKEVNNALRKANATPIDDDWYWTSTESSAAYAWGLYLNYGFMHGSTKATNQHRVRPVSAFIS